MLTAEERQKLLEHFCSLSDEELQKLWEESEIRTQIVNFQNRISSASNEDSTSKTGKTPAPKPRSIVDRRRQLGHGGRGFVLGSPASDKTRAVELQISSILRSSKDRIFVLDSEGRYTALAEQSGGQIIRPALDENVYINPFDTPLDQPNWDDIIACKTDLLISFCELLCGSKYGLSPSQKYILSRCVQKIYEPLLESKDRATGEYDQLLIPTMRDFYRLLTAQCGFDAYELAERIRPLFSTRLNTFTHPTNVEPSKQLVVFDLSGFDTIDSACSLLLLLEHVWQQLGIPEGLMAFAKYTSPGHALVWWGGALSAFSNYPDEETQYIWNAKSKGWEESKES